MSIIRQFEGSNGTFEATRTQDPGGLWEIGWSHRISANDPLWDATIGEDEANALAEADLNEAAADVCDELGASVDSLTDPQYAAIIDFCYNEGGGQFHSSTLLRVLKADNLSSVPTQLERWVYGRDRDGNVVKLNGLVRRRAAEVALWNQLA